MASPSNRSEYSPKEKAPPTLTPTSIKHQSTRIYNYIYRQHPINILHNVRRRNRGREQPARAAEPARGNPGLRKSQKEQVPPYTACGG